MAGVFGTGGPVQRGTRLPFRNIGSQLLKLEETAVLAWFPDGGEFSGTGENPEMDAGVSRSRVLNNAPLLSGKPDFAPFLPMMTAHELFGFMSPKLANEILEWTFKEDKQTYKVALHSVAAARKVRPVYLERQQRTQRHAGMAAAFARPMLEQAAANLLRTWLTKAQTGLLTDFLDALELKHEKGVVEELPGSVEDAKLNGAVNTLLEKHPQENVAVYLNAFNSMNETSWANLDALLKNDDRLQLHG
ncbi:MAG TPA: hypothetical protein DCY13_15370 [Verrucomicrobiales bacterium]|nr:hypothetical protein [Verrucomicrobiales bacterium]